MSDLLERAEQAQPVTAKRGRPKKATPVPARIEDAPPVAPSETGAVLAMIERVARDPGIDIARLERLLDMQERVLSRNAKAAFDGALAEMQPELPVIDERGQIKVGTEVRSTYAKWPDINDAIKPILQRFGFSLRFRTSQAEGKISVTGVLSHGGHSEETTLALPIDTSGSKNAVQGIGSSTSYGQRYTAKLLLNITSRLNEDKDDDGKAAGAAAPITDEQVETIRNLIVETGSDIAKFCAWLKVERVEDISGKDYDRAIKALEKRKQ